MQLAILGGSGFLGNEILKVIFNDALFSSMLLTQYSRIVIFSRSEGKQSILRERYASIDKDGRLRFFIGDVRDKSRLKQALQGINHVIYAAAMKRVETCEYDPEEAVKTNVFGAMNVVDACISCKVDKCILTSTDKAVSPDTLYGSTKLCAERLLIAANNLGGTRFSVCRYANVIGSFGSVLQLWERQKAAGLPITLTDKRMTRMWISGRDAALFVLFVFENARRGGEIFIPKLVGKSMTDFANEHFPGWPTKEIGLRPSEKLHEDLISPTDARSCYERDGIYVVYPSFTEWDKDYFRAGIKMPEDFRMSSGGNNDHL